MDLSVPSKPGSKVATEIFPRLTCDNVLAFQFSTWYPHFSHVSIKSTIIRPLSDDFRRYLSSDGVFIPVGSEDQSVSISLEYIYQSDGRRRARSTLSDEDESDSESDIEQAHFAFPDLDKAIREVILEYGAVFPKLNFSSPKDASWILPASSPLKCTSPAEVYMLLKSSDFVAHDIDPENVFHDCEPSSSRSTYDLELVLRKWYSIDPSREYRCLVRQGILLGISQRDSNFYEFMSDSTTVSKITRAIITLWESEVKQKWPTNDYVFDVLLTRDLERGHIIDFNPFASRTDPLLFSYEELFSLFLGARSSLPVTKFIDSRSHPAATRNAPTNQHNMVPLEVLNLSSGQNIDDFARLWQDELQKATEDD